MAKRHLAFAILLVGLAIASGARAQKPSDPAADSTGVHASNLLHDIRDDLVRIDRYTAQQWAASVEDSIVIGTQLFEVHTDLLRQVSALAGDLTELEKQGPHPELRAEVVGVFERTTSGVWDHLSTLRSAIDRQRARRQTTAAADRPRLEDGIEHTTEQLDAAFQLAFKHLGDLAALGIATPADSTSLREQVGERADEVVGRMKVASQRITDLVSLRKEIPTDSDAELLLAAERISVRTESSSLAGLLPVMDAVGIPTTAAREQLVLIMKDVTNQVLDVNVALRLATRTWGDALAWVGGNVSTIVIKVLLIAIILIMARLLARLVRGVVGKAFDRRPGASVLVRQMAVRATGGAVMVLGVVIALGQLGINLGPLVAGLGVAGLIVGFALQSTLSNFASGLMILLYRPYDVGDWVEVSGTAGTVERMSLVSTNIVTGDNQMIVVPNGKIWGDVIKNVTYQTMRRVDLVFGIAYTDDIPKAERLLEEIIRGHAKVLQDPVPVVKLNKLNDSSVDFVVRPWTKRENYWEVYWDVTREVKMRFDAEGISIPFPQRDVHVYQEK